LAAKLQAAIPDLEIKLVGGGRGDFIVTVDSDSIWDKRTMGDKFPDESDIVSEVLQRMSG